MGKEKKIIIAIDGPAGAGKSTVADKVAKKLGYSHLDTGSMYRGATFFLIKNKVPMEKEEDVLTELRKMKMEMRENKIFINGENFTPFLRTEEVEKHVSWVSSLFGVRKILVQKQKDIAREGGFVLDGRDIGTQVCPNAELKIFLSASPEIRVKRRFFQLKEEVDLDFIRKDLKRRDEYDKNRKAGPLKPADDAIFLDSSHLTQKEVVEKIVRKAREVIGDY